MSKRIAVIPGDGVGPEVVAQGLKAIQSVCSELEFETFPWGSAFYEQTGQMMPDNGLEVLRAFDASAIGASRSRYSQRTGRLAASAIG